jgi:hypothetical protein
MRTSVISARPYLLCLLVGFINVPALAQDLPQDLRPIPTACASKWMISRRLAAVLRSVNSTLVNDTAAVIAREYLARGSAGLRVYAERYDVTGASIASALAAQPSLYADLDALADSILAQQDELRSAFRQLLHLFPDAAFPRVWFFVGGHGTRGLSRREGVLICAEGFADRPKDVVPLVLHELAHFQSAMVQGAEIYRRIFGPDQTLLALALREGSADLIAYLTTGRVNPAAERYGLAHEPELWSRFREDMHRRDPGDWMFVRPANPDWPPDLGYWIGYRIAKSYYDQARDKRQATLDILNLTDFDAFLRASGYVERVAR